MSSLPAPVRPASPKGIDCEVWIVGIGIEVGASCSDSVDVIMKGKYFLCPQPHSQSQKKKIKMKVLRTVLRIVPELALGRPQYDGYATPIMSGHPEIPEGSSG